jgi:lipid-binding SYLF domain-containing protein
MKKLLPNLVLIALVACGGAPRTESERVTLEQKAQSTLQAMISKDATLPSLLNIAAGYVVFPEIGKGGFIAGGAHGQGVLYSQGRVVGYVELSEASIGAQIGAQSFAELIVFRDSADLQRVKLDQFALSGNASAVMLSAGVAGSTYNTNSIMVFVMPRGGAMAELSVGGQELDFEPRG